MNSCIESEGDAAEQRNVREELSDVDCRRHLQRHEVALEEFKMV